MIFAVVGEKNNDENLNSYSLLVFKRSVTNNGGKHIIENHLIITICDLWDTTDWQGKSLNYPYNTYLKI